YGILMGTLPGIEPPSRREHPDSGPVFAETS
ncbi:MAG: hypothetical protein ACI9EZ_002022, partial [Halobacteriales archaeon]